MTWYTYSLIVNIQQKGLMSLAIASKSESINHYWTDSSNLPAPQIHNVSYWNPHVYSLGLLRQSWNKNASSVLHIAIWLHTFWEKKKRLLRNRLTVSGHLTAGEPPCNRHRPQQPLQSQAFIKPSVKRKTSKSSLEVQGMIKLKI